MTPRKNSTGLEREMNTFQIVNHGEVPPCPTIIQIETIFTVHPEDHSMKWLLCLLALCLAACSIAGCCNAPVSRPPVASAVNDTPHYGTTPFSQPVVFSLIPDPVESMPAMYEVQVQAGKNPVASDPYISVNFRGGAGQMYTHSLEATVIRSDRTVEFESLPDPQVGSEIILNGTPKPDRLIVDITMSSGDRYRILDELMPLKSRN